MKRLIRAAKALARDRSLPRWLRVAFGFACLPIPGPFDEVVQVAIVLVLLAHPRWRVSVRRAWREA